MGIRRFAAQVNASGDFTLLGRVTAIDGTGSLSPADPAEGNLIRQADLSAVTLSLYDLSSNTPSVPLPGFSGLALTIASVIFNTIQSGGIWNSVDFYGGNFMYTIRGSNIPNTYPDHTYLAVVTFTTTGGGTDYAEWKLTAVHVGPP